MISVQIYSQKTLGFKLPENVNRINIPFEFYNNLIVIPVVLNDVLALKFILDTGVRTTILTEKAFSDILNLNYEKQIIISGIGGKKLVNAYMTNGVSIELPGVKGEGHSMLVLEKDYLELSNYLGTQVHGILGYEIFSRFIVKIDFSKKIVSLIHPKKFNRKRKFTSIPITIEDTKPYISTEVTQYNGKKVPMKLLIDSGASHGLWLEPNADTVIAIPNKTINSNIGRGLGGDLTGKVGRVNKLAFGGFEFREVIAIYPDSHHVDSTKVSSIFRHGALGGEILSRFTVIFDYSSEMLYLKKNVAYKKAFEYNMSGLVIKAIGSKLEKFKIVEVREGSPAQKAGVQSGDFVLSINNHQVDDLSLQIVIGMFNSRPNKTLRLKLQREGKQIFKKFKLEQQI